MVLAAACGVVVPMMSGRALAHTVVTLGKLDSIPGVRKLHILRYIQLMLSDVGCRLRVHKAEIAPADKTLYALRDVTSTFESILLIIAWLMSTKIAVGIDSLLLDVMAGRGGLLPTP